MGALYLFDLAVLILTHRISSGFTQLQTPVMLPVILIMISHPLTGSVVSYQVVLAGSLRDFGIV